MKPIDEMSIEELKQERSGVWENILQFSSAQDRLEINSYITRLLRVEVTLLCKELREAKNGLQRG